MEVKVTITRQELEAIKAYADFMRDNEEPCDRKCGPPGSPDRRACCGCPEHGEWEKQVKEFIKAKGLTNEMLKNEAVKRYIATHNKCIIADRMLKTAEKRVVDAEREYQDALDAFIMSVPVTVTNKTQFVDGGGNNV